MKKLLIIDDNESILLSLQLILQEYGYIVDTLPDTIFLKEKITEFKPTLVIIDMFLNGENGLDVAKKLKEDEEFKTLPILLFSANYSVSKLKQHVAINDFIQKPFEIEELVQKIESINC